MTELVLGTVTAVDRVAGTVDATLRSGLALFGAPYQGNPPWKGLEARFNEVSPGAWICLGVQGDLGGYGPNLCDNGDFEESVAGWDNTAVRAWNFDGTTESWTASNATLAPETTYTHNGTGSLKVTCTVAGVVQVRSPTGASGESITVGLLGQGSVWIQNDPTKNARAVTARIKWYNGATFLSNSADGTAVTTDGSAWRTPAATATAPVSTTKGAIEFSISSCAVGDVFYLDTGIFTGGTAGTVSRDTTYFYEGSASLRVRSAAAGTAYAQYPAPASDPAAGIPVTAGEVYFVDCRFRQSNAVPMFILAAWVYADGLTVPDISDFNSRSVAGTTAMQAHAQAFYVPTGAVAVHFVFAFQPTAANQDLNVDKVRIRQLLYNPGAVVGGALPDGFAPGVGGKQQAPGLITFIAQENDWPRIVMNGYAQYRAMKSRIVTPSGTQNITAASWQTVTLNTVEAATPAWMAEEFFGAYWVRILRNGWYGFSGTVNWADWFGSTTGGSNAVAVERWSSDGTTFIKRVASSSAYYGVTAGLVSSNCHDDGQANRDERIILRVYQNHGSTLTLDPAGTVGLAHALAVTYLGD